jgi:hypothetical protein
MRRSATAWHASWQFHWHKPTSHTRAHAEQKTQHHQGPHHSRLLYHAANLPISEPALSGAGLPVDMVARRARPNRPSCVRAGAPAITARPHPLATAAMCAAVLLLLRAVAATAALHMRCIRKRQRRTCTRQGCAVCGAHRLWWSGGQEGGLDWWVQSHLVFKSDSEHAAQCGLTSDTKNPRAQLSC